MRVDIVPFDVWNADPWWRAEMSARVADSVVLQLSHMSVDLPGQPACGKGKSEQPA